MPSRNTGEGSQEGAEPKDSLVSPPLPDARSTGSDRPASASAVATIPDSRGRFVPADPSPPRRIADRYELRGLIGQGAMGSVYRAFDTVLKRHVAVKLLGGNASSQLSRFLQEAKAQARIDHPNVCKVFDAGFDGSASFIAMQLIEGGNLKVACEGRSLEEKVAAVAAAADGVHAAHKRGMVHRDLKPANILVEKADDGRLHPYVVDFGLARDLAGPALTATGTALGTPAYMAPEQARGESGSVDRRADVYSLGATLYELVSGTPPFPGESAVDVMLRALLDEPEPLRKRNPAVPADLEVIAAKALEKSPERRYESARALGEDLRRFLDGEPILARPPGPLDRLVRKARKHKAASIIAALSLLAVFTAFGALVIERLSARDRIRLAQELGQEVSGIEALVRHVYMLPGHDVTRDEARVRNEIRLLANRVETLGRSARGPGMYALGRGLLALGSNAEAAASLDEAWKLGVRDPGTAHALGVAYGNLYERALEEARQLSNAALRELRIADAESRYRARALEFLQKSTAAAPGALAAPGVPESPGSGSAAWAPELLEALLAYYDRRHDVALEKAEAAGQRLPWLWEAPHLVARVHIDRAEIARLSGRHQESVAALGAARLALERAESIARSARPVHEALCQVWVRLLNVTLDAAGDVPDAYERASAGCTSALAIVPGSATLQLEMADANRFLAEYQIARGLDPSVTLDRMASYAEAASLVLPSSGRPASSLGTAFYYRGEFQKRQGTDPRPAYKKALAALGRALELEPDSRDLLNTMGQIESRMALWERDHGIDPLPRYRRAIETYRLAAQSSPGWSTPHSNLGVALIGAAGFLLDRGENATPFLTEAIASLERSIAINPKDRKPHNNLGWARRVAADDASVNGRDPQPHLLRAEESLRAAIVLDPAYALAWVNLGEVFRTRAELQLAAGRSPLAAAQEAIGAFQKAAEVNPSYADPPFGLGEIHRVLAQDAASRGEPPHHEAKAALSHLGRAIEIQPDMSNAHMERGRVYLVLARSAGRPADESQALARAREAFDRALELFHGSRESLRGRAECDYLEARRLSRQGREISGPVSSAKAFIQRAKAVNPRDADVLALERKVEELTREGRP